MKKIISFILIFFTLLWFFYVLYRERALIENMLSNLDFFNFLWLFLSLICGCISSSVLILIFKKILSENSGVHYPLKKLVYIYFIGQLIRYLPGRFFGVLYQMNEIKSKIPPWIILKANIEFMILSLILNFVFSGAMMVYYHYSFIKAFIFFFVGVIGVIIYFNYKIVERCLFVFRKMIPEKGMCFLNKLFSNKVFSLRLCVNFILVYLISWIFYLMGWESLKHVFPRFDNINMYLLCAHYTLAISIGIMSMITPGGLGVRETVFMLFVGETLSASILGFMSVFLRLWMMSIDLLLFIIAVLFFSEKSKKN